MSDKPDPPDEDDPDWWRADAAGNYNAALAMIRERKQREEPK